MHLPSQTPRIWRSPCCSALLHQLTYKQMSMKWASRQPQAELVLVSALEPLCSKTVQNPSSVNNVTSVSNQTDRLLQQQAWHNQNVAALKNCVTPSPNHRNLHYVFFWLLLCPVWPVMWTWTDKDTPTLMAFSGVACQHRCRSHMTLTITMTICFCHHSPWPDTDS